MAHILGAAVLMARGEGFDVGVRIDVELLKELLLWVFDPFVDELLLDKRHVVLVLAPVFLVLEVAVHLLELKLRNHPRCAPSKAQVEFADFDVVFVERVLALLIRVQIVGEERGAVGRLRGGEKGGGAARGVREE